MRKGGLEELSNHLDGRGKPLALGNQYNG